MPPLAYRYKIDGVHALAAKYAHRGRAITTPSFCRRTAKQVVVHFLARIHVTEEGCWQWMGGKTSAGYGAVTFWNRTVRASQFAFAIKIGKAPKLGVLHTCDNPICCNPAHLFEGDDLANMQDRKSKGRYATVVKGEDHPRAILTEENVRSIRFLLKEGASQRCLALEYGVSRKTIYLIKNRINWQHI